MRGVSGGSFGARSVLCCLKQPQAHEQSFQELRVTPEGTKCLDLALQDVLLPAGKDKRHLLHAASARLALRSATTGPGSQMLCEVSWKSEWILGSHDLIVHLLGVGRASSWIQMLVPNHSLSPAVCFCQTPRVILFPYCFYSGLTPLIYAELPLICGSERRGTLLGVTIQSAGCHTPSPSRVPLQREFSGVSTLHTSSFLPCILSPALPPQALGCSFAQRFPSLPRSPPPSLTGSQTFPTPPCFASSGN